MELITVSKLFGSMKFVEEAYSKRSFQAAIECNLTKPEADVLLFLANHPDCCTAKEMVYIRRFSKAYISKAIVLLQQKGLIETKTDQKDHRFIQLKLTKKAEPTTAKLLKMQEEFCESLFDDCTAEEIKVFVKVLENLLIKAMMEQ